MKMIMRINRMLGVLLTLAIVFDCSAGEWIEKFYPGLEANGKMTVSAKGYRGKEPVITLTYLSGATKFGAMKEVKTELKGPVEWKIAALCHCYSGGSATVAMQFFDADGGSLGVREAKPQSPYNWKETSWSILAPKSAVRSEVHLLNVGKGVVHFARVRITSQPGQSVDEMPLLVSALPADWNRDWNGGKAEMLSFIDAPLPISFLMWGVSKEVKDPVFELTLPAELEIRDAFCPNQDFWGVEKPELAGEVVYEQVKCNRYRFVKPRCVRGLPRYRDFDRMHGIAVVVGPRSDVRLAEGAAFKLAYRVYSGGSAGVEKAMTLKFVSLPKNRARAKYFRCFSWICQDRYFSDDSAAKAAFRAYAAAGMVSSRREYYRKSVAKRLNELNEIWRQEYPETIFATGIGMIWVPTAWGCQLNAPLMKKYGVKLVKTIDAAHQHKGLICPQQFIDNEQLKSHVRQKVVKDSLRDQGARDGDWVNADLEPWQSGTYCYCDDCLKAFAKFKQLAKVPTVKEAAAMGDDWADFRTYQTEQSTRLMSEAIREYNPTLRVIDYDYIIEYGNLNAERAFRRGCAKDALRNERWVDGHLTSFYHTIDMASFKAIKNGVAHLKGEYWPLAGWAGYGSYLRPGEVLNPRQIRQLALASFVNGCPGFGFYAGNCYDGAQLLALIQAQTEIAKYDHLPWGKRPGKSVPTSKSNKFAYASVVGEDGRETVALFNYNGDDSITVDLNGRKCVIRPYDTVFEVCSGVKP